MDNQTQPPAGNDEAAVVKFDGLKVIKVRAGFYRVGAYCIHKGHRWCCYHNEKLLHDGRKSTLQEAVWWAQNNQPKPTNGASGQ